MPNENQGAKAAAASESYWRSFPVLERTLTQENPQLLKQIEATCRQLDAIEKSGSGAEKARAREAMQGFARALELYRELVDRREKMVEAGNFAKPRREK
jgi:hypothetical protein